MSDQVWDDVDDLLKNVQDFEWDPKNWHDPGTGRYPKIRNGTYKQIPFEFSFDQQELTIRSSIKNQSWGEVVFDDTNTISNDVNEISSRTLLQFGNYNILENVCFKDIITLLDIKETLIKTLDGMCQDIPEVSRFIDRKISKIIRKANG